MKPTGSKTYPPPLARKDADRGPGGCERRAGQDVQHAAIAIRAVERRTRAAHDLDALDVLRRDRNEIVDVVPERRKPRRPVVGEREEGAGLRAAESASDDARLGHALAGDIDAGQRPHIVRHGKSRALPDGPGAHHGDRSRSFQRLLAAARNGHDHRVDADGGRRQIENKPHRVRSGESEGSEPHSLVSDPPRAEHEVAAF